MSIIKQPILDISKSSCEIIDNYIVVNDKRLKLFDDLYIKTSNNKLLHQIKNELNSSYKFPPEKFSSLEIFAIEKKIITEKNFLINNYDIEDDLIYSDILCTKNKPGLALSNFLSDFDLKHPHYSVDEIKKDKLKYFKKMGTDYFENHKKLINIVNQECLKLSSSKKACIYALTYHYSDFMSAFLLVTERSTQFDYGNDIFESHFSESVNYNDIKNNIRGINEMIQDYVLATTIVTNYIKNSFDEKNYYPYNLLKNGENQLVEFKETLRRSINNKQIPDNVVESWVLKTLVGFANKNGGDLFIGVDDDGNVTGLVQDGFKSNDDFLKHLKNIIKGRIKPDFFEISNGGEIKIINGKYFCHISCQNQINDYKDFWVKEKNDWKFYVRKGPSTEELKNFEITEHLRNRLKNLKKDY